VKENQHSFRRGKIYKFLPYVGVVEKNERDMMNLLHQKGEQSGKPFRVIDRQTKVLLAQYKQGSRDPDVVMAYREWHREYARRKYGP